MRTWAQNNFQLKYYIIAGEASGDLHASNLMKALKEEDTTAQFRVWGGDKMQVVGATLVKHYRDLAFMGFVEVVKNLRTILGNLSFCKTDILEYQADVLILVDYPGFNLRIAKWAKAQGIKVFYYISPQIWAWHSSRVHAIKASVDRMFVILPFEADFYKKYDYKVDFVGHPLLDVVENYASDADFYKKNKIPQHKPIVAILPGSRQQEIKALLPLMLEMAKAFEAYHFVIAGAPAQQEILYQKIRTKILSNNISFVQNATYDLLKNARAALVASGTATLETALFQVPQVVCYKGNAISYQIAKHLVNVKYISLVNLIADKPLVKELIQGAFNHDNLKNALAELLDEKQVKPLLRAYEALHEQLGKAGASKRTARLMYNYLQEDV